MIRDVVFPNDTEELNSLIREYVGWLNIDLSYQDFEGEMAAIESLFTPPNGQYTFAIVNSKIAGGVGFKRINSEVAEVKRLYVRSEYQGLSLGRVLMNNLLEKLTGLGYKKVVLDAVPPTVHAKKLYESMGFYEIEPYFNNPTPNTKFYCFNLGEFVAPTNA
jgi:putative acetyltransferase